MRKNFPVNEIEYTVPVGVCIVSKTDLRGVITYANEAFVQASGFGLDELLGQPHNMVRHPDMPEWTFADLWNTVKSGAPWKGIVKNRRSDGGFYWVKAVVVPVRQNDLTVGYMSVREAASRAEIEAAQAIYANRPKANWVSATVANLKRRLTIRKGFVAGGLFVTLLMVVGGILGIGGLQTSSTAAAALYQQRIQPMAWASEFDTALHQKRGVLSDFYLLHYQPNVPQLPIADTTREQLIQRLQQADAQAEQALVKMLAAYPVDNQDLRLRALKQGFEALRSQVLEPQRGLIAQGLVGAPAALPVAQYLAHFNTLHALVRDYQQAVNAAARQDWKALEQRNTLIQLLALFGIAFGMLVIALTGRIFVREMVEPLERAMRSLDRIAQGDLSGAVEVKGYGESCKLIQANAVMQLHLRVITEQIIDCGREINMQCAQLNHSLFEISDYTERQYDQLSDASSTLNNQPLKEMRALLDEIRLELAALASSPEPVEMRDFDGRMDQVFNLIEVQSIMLQDFQQKIDQLLDLVMENRNQSQASYGLAQRLKAVAQQLHELVSVYQVHAPSKNTVASSPVSLDQS